MEDIATSKQERNAQLENFLEQVRAAKKVSGITGTSKFIDTYYTEKSF